MTTRSRRLGIALASVGLAVGFGLATAVPMARPAAAQTAWTVTLSASKTTPTINQAVTLTAVTNQDVGPTPYWIDIYDLGNNSLVTDCGFGTTCSGTVNKQTPTCDTYQAYVADLSSSNPPSNIQATSNPVTVCWQLPSPPTPPWTVSLVGQPTQTVAGTPAALAAVTDNNVGPTPYWLEIYDLNTAQSVAICATGVDCTATVSNGVGCHDYVAEVAPYSTSYPAAGAVATSNTVAICWQ